MEDEDKLYWLKMIMGAGCGILSIFIFPQSLSKQGVPIGWFRLIWLLVSWLLLPFPIVLIGMRLGLLGMTEKEKRKLEEMEERGDELPKFTIKGALKKIGGGKFILKTGVGAYFFWFMFASTFVFTIVYPLLV